MRSTRLSLTLAVAAAALTMLAACQHAPSRGTAADAEANRRAVLAFYDKGLNQKDADAALQYVGSRYVQHNPTAPDGPEGFRQFVKFLREKYPQSRSEIKRSFVDGDYVILHVHSVREPGTPGSAIVDIFRLEGGRIVEHWDVVQPVAEKPANGNGMF